MLNAILIVTLFAVQSQPATPASTPTSTAATAPQTSPAKATTTTAKPAASAPPTTAAAKPAMPAPATTAASPLPATPAETTAKAQMKIKDLLEFNFEGLSQRATLWILVVIIGGVIATNLVTHYFRPAAAAGPSPVLLIGTVLAIGAIGYFVLQWTLKPFSRTGEIASSTVRVLEDARQEITRQATRVSDLEKQLAAAQSELQTLPKAEAALLVERERVNERDRELAAQTAALRETRTEAATLRERVAQQREELLRQQYDSTGMIGLFVLAVAVLAAAYRLGTTWLRTQQRLADDARGIAQAEVRAADGRRPSDIRIIIRGTTGTVETTGVGWSQETIEKLARELNAKPA